MQRNFRLSTICAHLYTNIAADEQSSFPNLKLTYRFAARFSKSATSFTLMFVYEFDSKTVADNSNNSSATAT